MGVRRVPGCHSANFFPPVLSLFRMLLEIVENELLGTVEAHKRQRASKGLENNHKPAPTAGLQFIPQLLTVR